MKRYIRSSIVESDYIIDIDASEDCTVDTAALEEAISDIIQEQGAAPYVSRVDVHLGTLSSCDIRVFSTNSRIKQLRVTASAAPTERTAQALLNKLDARLPEFVAHHEKLAAVPSNKKVVSAQALVQQLIKKKFGFTPSFSYADTHKTQYMLWELPFAIDKYTLDVELGEKLQNEMDAFLQEIEAEYDIELEWYLPLEGSRIYACWEIKCPDIRFVIDKKTGEAEKF